LTLSKSFKLSKIVYQLLGSLLILLVFFNSCKKDDKEEPVELKWKTLSLKTPYYIDDMSFYKDSVGVAAIFDKILITRDGGESWEEKTLNVDEGIRQCFVLDDRNFYISKSFMLDDRFYRSRDGGSTFTEFDDFRLSSYYGIHFFDTTKGIIFSYGGVSITNNGGKDWVGRISGNLSTVKSVASDSVVYIAGEDDDGNGLGAMYKTKDQGESWVPVNLPSIITSSIIEDIDFLNENKGYISTRDHRIFTTDDGGSSWTFLYQHTNPILDMIFRNQDVGYFSSGYDIYETTDGGRNWRLESKLGVIIYRLYKSENHIFASALSGELFKY